jgi:Flp pilus assembly protein TadG
MSSIVRCSAFRKKLRTRGTDGSAAIEFAFIAPVFFALMLGILQLGIMIFSQFTLQNAVINSARLIRTGQAQNITTANASSQPQCSGATTPAYGYATPAAWFQGQICCGVSAVMDCTRLSVTVAPSSSFGGSGFSGLTTPGYNPGAACDVVLAMVTYKFPIWVPGLSQLLKGGWTFEDTAGSGSHTIWGTAAFRNEPFDPTTNGC